MTTTPPPPVSLLTVALVGRCPRCGAGRLFAGLLNVGACCSACRLGLSGARLASGLAVVAVLALGAAVAGLVFRLEDNFLSPWWFHTVLWIPFVGLGALLLLRAFTAFLVALDYRVRPERYGGGGGV